MSILILLCLLIGASAIAGAGGAESVHLVEQPPVSITTVAPGVFLVDFGRVAFGNIVLSGTENASGKITVHFGEAFAKGRIDRKPPGTVRYAVAQVAPGEVKRLVVAPPADRRNTKQPAAILTPPQWGVVLPFRWVEIEGLQGELRQEQICRQAAFASTWNDDAAAFRSSDAMLDRIWELCRYSIKATTFAGVYVDGDRERIPYEADAYLNQLSHYFTDDDLQMARDTFDRLMECPTWPTEWASHMVFVAHADWMQSGDTTWLAPRYESLKTKLLTDRIRSDGLVVSDAKQVRRDDIVDWPAPERDGFVFTPVNSVVNAFNLRAIAIMSELAAALGKSDESQNYAKQERKARVAFQQVFFDSDRRLYRDGETTDHASLHANLFPLAFGLVPDEFRIGVADWCAQRGMRCSVYAAQYLLEGLFQNESGDAALALIIAPGDRSWRHMVESGTTITWEAWDQKYKPNQDWNHAWGAAPANLLPRFVLGAQPLEAGWRRVLIRPNLGSLKFAEGKIPTPRGAVLVSWKNGNTLMLDLTLPKGVAARVELPATASSKGVFTKGQPVNAHRSGTRWVLDEDVIETVSLEIR